MIDTLAQATVHGFGEWLQHQVTVGNLVSIGSVLIAFGYQMRRLQDIERDLLAVREAQRVAVVEVAATYTRRDVLAEMLQTISSQQHGISDRLASIEIDLRYIKHMTHEGAR